MAENWYSCNAIVLDTERISANTLGMSPKEMRVRADECERLADSPAPTPDDLRKMLREIAAQWRRLADDGEAHPKPSVSPG